MIPFLCFQDIRGRWGGPHQSSVFSEQTTPNLPHQQSLLSPSLIRKRILSVRLFFFPVKASPVIFMKYFHNNYRSLPLILWLWNKVLNSKLNWASEVEYEENESHVCKQLSEVNRVDENPVLFMYSLPYGDKKPIESVAWSQQATSARLNYTFYNPLLIRNTTSCTY